MSSPDTPQPAPPGPVAAPASNEVARPALARQPFRPDELAAALARPVRVVDVVLAAPARLAANLERRESLGALAGVLLLAASAFAVPYGCVLAWSDWWKIIALYLGSTAICLPSLHVFATYVGVRASLGQIACLALTIPAVAALFTFGFAPILWFLRLTMDESARQVSWLTMSSALLTLAALAGVVQLARALAAWMRAEVQVLFVLVLLAWHAVFAYVLIRMGGVLGLGR